MSRQPSSKVAQEGSHFSLDLEGAVQRVEVVGAGQGPQRQGDPSSLWAWQRQVLNSTTFHYLCLWGRCWHPVQGRDLTAVFAQAISDASS